MKLQEMVTESAVSVHPSCIHTSVRWSLCIALRLNLASCAYRCSRRFLAGTPRTSTYQYQTEIQPNGVLSSASDGHERQSAVETPDVMAPQSDASTEHGFASRTSAIEVPPSYRRFVLETPISTYTRGHMSAENAMLCHERFPLANQFAEKWENCAALKSPDQDISSATPLCPCEPSGPATGLG